MNHTRTNTRTHKKSPTGHWDHGTLLSIDELYPNRSQESLSNKDIRRMSGRLKEFFMIVLLAVMMGFISYFGLGGAVGLPFEALVHF